MLKHVQPSPPDHTGNVSAMPLLIAVACTCLAGLFPLSVSAESDRPGKQSDVFRQFTQHIQRQIELDKTAFAQASGCTNWFYHQDKQPSAPPLAQPIRLDLVLQPPSKEECLRAYPRGLDSVRQDFHRTQTSLSVSLTFYEYALVGDRNDDGRYSLEELQDIFPALALTFDSSRSPGAQAASLAGRFDDWYRLRNLEHLMTGMAQLYEKGYRVSPADRAELDRVTK
ncbi:MAG: hypothetical protein K2X00_16685 [Nitrospiraceae bacterium]|jgi:hypothetical protein|nr:hypothetical protein [Nitrospiraceae bacterium]OQW66347.1 MAG: hypothetical protein BVN29_07770 [Nitrospira sp. ST-bin5]